MKYRIKVLIINEDGTYSNSIYIGKFVGKKCIVMLKKSISNFCKLIERTIV